MVSRKLLAEGAIALSVALSGDVLFASSELIQFLLALALVVVGGPLALVLLGEELPCRLHISGNVPHFGLARLVSSACDLQQVRSTQGLDINRRHIGRRSHAPGQGAVSPVRAVRARRLKVALVSSIVQEACPAGAACDTTRGSAT